MDLHILRRTEAEKHREKQKAERERKTTEILEIMKRTNVVPIHAEIFKITAISIKKQIFQSKSIINFQ